MNYYTIQANQNGRPQNHTLDDNSDVIKALQLAGVVPTDGSAFEVKATYANGSSMVIRSFETVARTGRYGSDNMQNKETNA